jgi:hypothetical protein
MRILKKSHLLFECDDIPLCLPFLLCIALYMYMYGLFKFYLFIYFTSRADEIQLRLICTGDLTSRHNLAVPTGVYLLPGNWIDLDSGIKHIEHHTALMISEREWWSPSLRKLKVLMSSLWTELHTKPLHIYCGSLESLRTCEYIHQQRSEVQSKVTSFKNEPVRVKSVT